MAQRSKIEWTESTWNPVTGCTKISSGCLNCYAERMAKRLQSIGNKSYQNGFEVSLHPEMLEKPLLWKTPQAIFVNSMSDLFHDSVPDDFIFSIFDVMKRAFWHRFQILTKRAERVFEMNAILNWPENVWMGVTVEKADYLYRIDYLRQTDATIKFLSLEPLLGAIKNIDLTNIDWVICGGESGPNARPIEVEWVRGVRDQCVIEKVPFFFKQWGGMNKKKAGRLLDNHIWSQMPQKRRRKNNNVQTQCSGR